MAIYRKKEQTKRSLDALETKTRVFETSIRLFSKYGYDAVTIDDITQKAGVSKGTFYTHFGSKDAVLVEQFQKIDDAYEAAFSSVPADMPAIEQLNLLLETMCHYCADVCGINVMKVVYINQIGLSERASILNNDERIFFRLLRQIVKQGIAEDIFSGRLNESEWVRFLAMQAHALIYEWCLLDGNLDMTAAGKKHCALLTKESIT